MRLLSRVFLSPTVIFIIGYLYFGDLRKAVLVSLIFYTGFSLLNLLMSGPAIITSVVSVNFFKFIKKSFALVMQVLILIVYWIVYVLFWGMNFSL